MTPPRETGAPEPRDADFSKRLSKQLQLARDSMRALEQELREADRGLIALTTELEEKAERLRTSEQRFRLLVEGSELVFFYEHDREGRFTYVSPSVETVLGYKPEELLDETYENLLVEAGAEDVIERTQSALDSGERDGAYLARVRSAAGKEITLELVERRIELADGSAGIQGFARDVTKRIELERQFRQAQKMEAVGRLAGGIAHDFNNVLTAIQGHVSLVLEESDSANPWRSDLNEIKSSAERATGLTRQLLAFSREQILQPRVLDLTIVASAVESMLRRVVGAEIRMCMELCPEPAWIKADPTQVEQIILNLVINARDAMPEGGDLTLRIEHTDAPATIGESAPNVENWVCLSVEDTGVGMTSHVMDHLFEPFFTTKAEGKGTGLGLSTVFGIVEQSGGDIAVASSPGEGSIFQVYLPAVEAPTAPAEQRHEENASPASPVAFDGGVVVVVEDEQAVRSLVRRVLERGGLSVLPAENGRQALDILERVEGRVDLIVTDLSMPEMNGSELIGLLNEAHPSLRILLMSGHTADDAVRGEIASSNVAFLSKPFTPTDLLEAVRSMLAE